MGSSLDLKEEGTIVAATYKWEGRRMDETQRTSSFELLLCCISLISL